MQTKPACHVAFVVFAKSGICFPRDPFPPRVWGIREGCETATAESGAFEMDLKTKAHVGV